MSRQAMYSKVSSYTNEIIETLIEEMRNGDNSNARIGAAKTLINKVLPDLKVTEIQGDVDKPLGVVVLPPLEKEKNAYRL